MEERRISVKINAVLQRGVNDMECIALAELAKNHKLDVRFIELMPIGYGKTLEPVSNPEILKRLRAHYGSERVIPDSRTHGNGPARYYRIDGFSGSIGFISAIHGKFCSSLQPDPPDGHRGYQALSLLQRPYFHKKCPPERKSGGRKSPAGPGYRSEARSPLL